MESRHFGQSEDLLMDLPQPGLEADLTSQVVLDLLHIPQAGLLRISAALFFLGNQELFAFYWKDDRTHQEHCKFVSADSVRMAFGRTPFESGWLPPNTLRFGVSEQGVRWLAMFIPPGIHHLQVEDDERGLLQVQVPLPGLIFTGRGYSYWVWATKESQPSGQSIVYHAPLSNVAGDGSICFGANVYPTAEAETIEKAMHLFLTSPFNGHQSNGKSRSFPGDVRYLLFDLAKQGQFPLDDLVPIRSVPEPDRNLTVEILLQHVLRRYS